MDGPSAQSNQFDNNTISRHFNVYLFSIVFLYLFLYRFFPQSTSPSSKKRNLFRRGPLLMPFFLALEYATCVFRVVRMHEKKESVLRSLYVWIRESIEREKAREERLSYCGLCEYKLICRKKEYKASVNSRTI